MTWAVHNHQLTNRRRDETTVLAWETMREGEMMKTPKDKYMSDPEYNNLVNMLESLIERAHFTPSELREACILASINYEMRHIRDNQLDPRVRNAFETIDKFISRPRRR